ncbi:hypothetical protein CCZ01_05005 [Helicobacter monodelphidis]|uniref:hypothetical protein n=1 Tax=Helicobacter sp. 15-1451 TaxID=2004995 RepID=UPI000DCE850A|nr:hypothetical protein [Helicobacter sp. 15-1451]RAX57809.1 hypothetical protein CCZ01_05005 [Helicobacter sp. 15-1451]
MPLSYKDLVAQLQLHGHSLDKLKQMDLEDIQSLFNEESKKFINSFEDILIEQGIVENEKTEVDNGGYPTPLKHYWDQIIEHRNSADDIYTIIGAMVKEHEYEDILDFFAHMSTGSFFKSLEGMLLIKCSEYQEILLDKIEEYYKELPPDELEEQMAHYTAIRFQIHRLEFVLQKLKKDNQKYTYMAHLKEMIVRDFIKYGEEESGTF